MWCGGSRGIRSRAGEGRRRRGGHSENAHTVHTAATQAARRHTDRCRCSHREPVGAARASMAERPWLAWAWAWSCGA
eukprot:scaffold4145_cov115-Isochrysis_galbana.AAC.3